MTLHASAAESESCAGDHKISIARISGRTSLALSLILAISFASARLEARALPAIHLRDSIHELIAQPFSDEAWPSSLETRESKMNQCKASSARRPAQDTVQFSDPLSRKLISFTEANAHFYEILNSAYPELKDFRVTLELSPPSPDFLWANFHHATLANESHNRDYVVFLNPKIFDDPPSARALRAIFVHELSHIRDYTRMSSVQILGFALNYALSPIRSYERATDLVAMEKGYAKGLAEYRTWLYQHVSGKVLKGKLRDYYQPEEIQTWLATHPHGECE